MAAPSRTMAQQIALAATKFQLQRTGHTPHDATTILSEDMLVVTLHDALSPAEKALAQTAEGAAQVQNFHRTLFQDAVAGLRDEIQRITGVDVREAAIEVETATGAVVQVFQLAKAVSVQEWNSTGAAKICCISVEEQALIDEGDRLADDIDAMEKCPLEKLWQIHDAQKHNGVTSLTARMFEVQLKLLCR